MGKRHAVLIGVLAAVLASFILATQGGAGVATKTTKIYMSALEYKGGANVSAEAYPPAEAPGTEALNPLGGGYGLKVPDATGRWEVNSYRFEPGFFSVEKDTRVTLEIAGINGALHDIRLINPSGTVVRDGVVVTRGRMTHVMFRPRSLGVWTLICDTHPPGMTASILVVE